MIIKLVRERKKRYLRAIISRFSIFFKLFIIKILYLSKKKIGKYEKKETIIFWNPGGGCWPAFIDLEGSIASSLKIRGHKVHAIIADGTYYAYSNRDVWEENDKKSIKTQAELDFKTTKRKIKSFGINHSCFGEYINKFEKKEAFEIASKINFDSLEEFKYKNIDVGINIKSTILRYLKGKEYTDKYKELLVEFTYASILNVIAAENAIKILKPTIAFMSHGIYVDWGPALKIFMGKGIKSSAYIDAYRPGSFFFKHIKNPKSFNILKVDTETWKKNKSDKINKSKMLEVDKFIKKRYFSDICVDINFDSSDEISIEEFKLKYNLIDEKRPVWAIFAHLNWDESGEFGNHLYPTLHEWSEKTIKHIMSCKNAIWLIKIHPQELKNPSKYNIKDFVSNLNLPENIKIIDADVKLNPYYFQEIIDGGVTVAGTAGLEIALKGKPVILAGNAHYGEKDFTINCKTKNEYLNTLSNAHKIKKLNQSQVENAYRYAHLFFFRKLISIPILVNKREKNWKFQFNKILDLIPGNEKNLSFICESILNGADYVK